MADKKIQLHTKDGTDNLYPVTKAANVTGLATVATSGSYNDLSNKPSIPTIPTNLVRYNDVLMPTNPFGGLKLYINSINNSLYAADKRFYVTATLHKRHNNGIEYPRVNSSKAITEDDYVEDGPVDSTLAVASLFDGYYDAGMAIKSGDYYARIRIMFGSNTSPKSSTSYFTGYPYGDFFLSYYYVSSAGEASKCRIYNKYEAAGLGWKFFDATKLAGNYSSSGLIEKITDGTDYYRTCVDFIIFSRSDANITLTQLDYSLSRPSLERDIASVTKFSKQKLYYPFEWYKDKTKTLELLEDGTIKAKSIYENGTALSATYAAKSHSHAQSDITGLSTSLAAKLDKSEADDTYAAIDHNHSGVYAAIDHNHSGVYAAYSHGHKSLVSNTDERAVNTTPNDYNGVFKIAGLKTNTKIGLTTTDGTYSAVLGIRGWADSSGGNSHELAFAGSNGRIKHRFGATTAWGDWKTLAWTSDIPAAVTESTVSGWGFTKNTGTYSKPSGGIPSTDVAFNYAGSSSKGGAASSVAQSLTFSNGGSGAASGTTYNGSTARTISYNSIGAAASSHTHAQTDITGLSTSLAAKLDKSEAEDTYAAIDHSHSASDITSGTLAVARGGTGKTTGADAANYFLNELSVGTSTPKDADYFISQYANGGTTTTTYHRRSVSALWDLYKTKCITGVHANTAASSSVYTGKPIMFVPGNNMSVTVSNTTSYVRVLLDSYGSCLIEGTKIKMIDGSEKNIEDIEPGESIMSYDPNTRTNVEAVVVSNSCTGTADDYTNYYFDDGNFVTIYGKHCLYNVDEGTARGVDFWEIGWTGMNDKNEEITFIGSEDISHAGRKKHYDIRSSNKLYYANGILTAQALTLDYSTLPDRDPELPQVFLDAIKADYDSSANITKHKMNKNYGKRLVPILREMKAQQKKMDDNKKRLADTDYIVSKFTEGLISASEWAKSKGERSNWRKLVNEAEDALVAVKTQFEALKEEYKPQSTKRERFNAAVARDNACLDALKEYYKEKNSK